jgi:hypothetical protein
MTGPRLAALKHLDCPVIAACSFPTSPNIRLSLKATHPLSPFPCVFSLGLFLVVSHHLQHPGSSSSLLRYPIHLHHLIPFVHRPSEASPSFLFHSRLGAGPPKNSLTLLASHIPASVLLLQSSIAVSSLIPAFAPPILGRVVPGA